MNPGITIKKLGDLVIYDRNPRSITKEKYSQLKKDIETGGFRDVLQLAADGYTVLGGNHRLLVLRDLGYEEVPCVIIEDANTDKKMFEWSLKLNHAYAYYEKEEVAELAIEFDISPIELHTYEINLGSKIVSLDQVLNELGPSEPPSDDMVECPNCGSRVKRDKLND